MAHMTFQKVDASFSGFGFLCHIQSIQPSDMTQPVRSQWAQTNCSLIHALTVLCSASELFIVHNGKLTGVGLTGSYT